MDREYYRSLAEAYQSIYEAPGAGALLQGAGRVVTNPQVIRQGGKIGGSLALQKLQNWPEYRQYRDQGYSETEAAEKIASRLGLNVAGSVVGGAMAAPAGPWASAAAGTLTGPMAVELLDALDQEKTKKQQHYENGIVWDDKSGKYVHKPENLTQYRREPDEDFKKRQEQGAAMAKELNAVEGGPKPPAWLEYERRREKERKREADNKVVDGLSGGRYKGGNVTRPTGPSNETDITKQFGIPNYTVSGIEYDGRTGRPVNPPPTAGTSGSVGSASQPDKLDDIINAPYTADQNIPDNQEGDVQKPNLDDIINAPYTADQNIPDNQEGDVQKPDKKPTNRDGSNVTQTGKNNKGLTPMQQWAVNFPHLAKKIRPGAAGYDEINNMPKLDDKGQAKPDDQAAQATPKGGNQQSQQQATPKGGNQQSQQQAKPQGRKGLMDVLGDYQKEAGYGDDDAPLSRLTQRTPAPSQQPNNTPTASGRPADRNNNRPATLGDNANSIRRGASRLKDAAQSTAEKLKNSKLGTKTGNALNTVKDAAVDTARSAATSQTGRTLINQGRKAGSAINRNVRDALSPADK